MLLLDIAPQTPPPGWEATQYPGAQSVIVEQFAPGAISSGEVAILAVSIIGFSLLAVLLILLLLRRNIGGR